MKYLEIRTFPARVMIEDPATPEPITLDGLLISRAQTIFMFNAVRRWLASIGQEGLLEGERANALYNLMQNGQQKAGNTASFLRLALRGTPQSEYKKLTTEHLFAAQRLDDKIDKLGPDLEKARGYLEINDDDWPKIRDIVMGFDGFRCVSMAPFLKMVDHPLDEIPPEKDQPTVFPPPVAPVG